MKPAKKPRCPEHPKYGAVKEPRNDCPECWAVWEKVREAKAVEEMTALIPKIPGPKPPGSTLPGVMAAVDLGTELSPNAANAKPKLVAALTKAGVDVSQVEHLVDAFCESYSEWVVASQAIKTYGILVMGQGFLRKNPAVEVRREAASMMIRLAEQMGMTPKAKHVLGNDGPPQPDAIDKFLES